MISQTQQQQQYLKCIVRSREYRYKTPCRILESEGSTSGIGKLHGKHARRRVSETVGRSQGCRKTLFATAINVEEGGQGGAGEGTGAREECIFSGFVMRLSNGLTARCVRSPYLRFRYRELKDEY